MVTVGVPPPRMEVYAGSTNPGSRPVYHSSSRSSFVSSSLFGVLQVGSQFVFKLYG